MKTEMRRKLARQPFEQKIRKVSQLIKLSAAVKSSRVREVEESGSAQARRAVLTETECQRYRRDPIIKPKHPIQKAAQSERRLAEKAPFFFRRVSDSTLPSIQRPPLPF